MFQKVKKHLPWSIKSFLLNKSMVVYNGISFPAIDSKFPLKDCEEKLIVGTIARMDYQKIHGYLFV